jgi:hypothetical protein
MKFIKFPLVLSPYISNVFCASLYCALWVVPDGRHGNFTAPENCPHISSDIRFLQAGRHV